MSINIKQAYEYARDVYEGFIITSCTELKDSWVFFANAKNDIAFIPPLEIMKSGKDLDFWEKYHQFNNCFEAAEWLNQNGKDISIKQLEEI
jgi:hypothetical protein